MCIIKDIKIDTLKIVLSLALFNGLCYLIITSTVIAMQSPFALARVLCAQALNCERSIRNSLVG